MVSKLYSRYVKPEQELLDFSSAELYDTLLNFTTARKHLLILEHEN